MSDTFSTINETLADQSTLGNMSGSISDPNFYHDTTNLAMLAAIDPNLAGDLALIDQLDQNEANWLYGINLYASVNSPVDPLTIAAGAASLVKSQQITEQDIAYDVNQQTQAGFLPADAASLFPISASPDGTPGVVAPGGPNGNPDLPPIPDPNSMPNPTVTEPGLVGEGLGPLVLLTPNSAPVGAVVAVAFQNTAGSASQFAKDFTSGAPQTVITKDEHDIAANFGADAAGVIVGKIGEGLGTPVSKTTQATPAIPVTAVGGIEIGNQITDGLNSILNQRPDAFKPPSSGVVAPAGPPSAPAPTTTTPSKVVPGVIAPSLGLSSNMFFLNSPSVNPATFDVAASGPTSSIAINNVISAVNVLRTDANPADFLPNVNKLAVANLNAEFTGAELSVLHGASYASASDSLTNSLHSIFHVSKTS